MDQGGARQGATPAHISCPANRNPRSPEKFNAVNSIEETAKTNPSQANVPWENFVSFVRQLSHDLRNQLNAAELQSALIGEITNDPELKSEVRRLRELVSKLGTTLQTLSTAVAEPRPTKLRYPAADFVSDLRKKIVHDYPEKSQQLKWEPIPDGAVLDIDPALIECAAIELFDNAFRHGTAPGEIRVGADVAEGQFSLILREPKKEAISDPAQWPLPLGSISHNHYGLGLRRAGRIVEAHGGKLTAEFDSASSTLTSRIMLPCSLEKS
jgi:Signal transduction histidine kinase